MGEVTLRPLVEADVDAHNAGEDEETMRWLSGGKGTRESTRRHFAGLAANAARGEGKRGFGIVVDGRLGGYVDCDPAVDDGLDAGEVNVSYAVHPWARRHGVATRAVTLMCDYLRAEGIGTRAALRIEPENVASLGVADRTGFRFVREFTSATDTHPDGTPVTFRLYLRDL
ncbi:GNAT family N-acetyltransferase [Flexivirga caeni]|uniref:N-acetyltransferase n=1 Tax=Flexivirga caeni TaxID=2294115 RepID=A0A3M9M3K6_9MICO|nr:GNAT family N-acetyltransferase [Flexivirga caeni]RNI19513.1 N-acetyltransferase [Flexivirga caeni]